MNKKNKLYVIGPYAILLTFVVAYLYCSAVYARGAISDFFGKSYAVVVGIDDYQNDQWPKLSYAVKDAKAVAQFLRSQGFTEVVVLLNDQATRAEIAYNLQDHLPGRLQDNDRLIFFFAGHGYTDRSADVDFGYIVPFDGANRTSSYISMQEIRGYSRRMGAAKHQLFVFDSCYGGLIGTRGVAAVSPTIPRYLEEITSRHARQYITAGGAGQQVLDGGPGGHSYFTAYLLEGLKDGKADINKDGIITFGELGAFLVPRATNEYQTPTHGDLPGHALGEFVFRGPGAISADEPGPVTPDEPTRGGTELGDGTLSIWKIGGPHRGGTPDPRVPLSVRSRAKELGLKFKVTTLAANQFFDQYTKGFDTGAAPDIIVIDNFGLLSGIKTDLGRFEGIYSHPGVEEAVTFVDETLKDFGSGWQLLTKTSPDHKYALALATPEPSCSRGITKANSNLSRTAVNALKNQVERAVSAYIACDQSAYMDTASPSSLDDGCAGKPTAIRDLKICNPSGNTHLSFVPVRALVDSEERVGQRTLLVAAQRPTPSEDWSILTITGDPISTRLIGSIPDLAKLYLGSKKRAEKAQPAVLTTPDGVYPKSATGERFGNFQWRRSPSKNVVLEIAEFNYGSASRLFTTKNPKPGVKAKLSTGQLWTTNGPWNWRVWSVGADGQVTLSAARKFDN
jgi:hypothetical protein